MDQSTLVAVGAIAAVVVVALLMRGMKGSDEAVTLPRPAEPSEDEAGPDGAADDDHDEAPDDDDEWDAREVVAVTSDGCALLPDRHAVRMLPPADEGEEWKAGEAAHVARGAAALARSWNAGDFTGARVVRGGGEEPWRLEALGRDGEYTEFGFETRDAADAALELFASRGVIRLGTNEDGDPMPPSPEQFAEARRIYEETEQALAMEPEPDDGRGA